MSEERTSVRRRRKRASSRAPRRWCCFLPRTSLLFALSKTTHLVFLLLLLLLLRLVPLIDIALMRGRAALPPRVRARRHRVVSKKKKKKKSEQRAKETFDTALIELQAKRKKQKSLLLLSPLFNLSSASLSLLRRESAPFPSFFFEAPKKPGELEKKKQRMATKVAVPAPPSTSSASKAPIGGAGLKAYYEGKIEELELAARDKAATLRRLEAQRNELNSKGEEEDEEQERGRGDRWRRSDGFL